MEYAVNVLWALGGLGALLYGMHVLSDCMQRSAGSGMRKLFDKITKNRLVGVGVGTVVTGIIQSSAATTVMVLGFVNAGLMDLFQATTVIMGANIGTTVTGLIMGLSAFEISPFLGALGAVGAFMAMMCKNEKAQTIGHFLTGLGLIFVGLELMNNGLSFFKDIPAVTTFFISIDIPVLMLFVGMIFTAVIQSSSAMTGILITFVGSGIMSLGASIYMVLGANIGTCITALLASLGGTANTKRAALIHVLFNVVGTVLVYPFIRIFNAPIGSFLLTMSGGEPRMALAFFHLIFNVLTTAVMIPFVKQLVFIVEKMIPKKFDGDEDHTMTYIDERIFATPSIAVVQIKKEIVAMANLARENLGLAVDALLAVDTSAKKAVDKNEERLDFLNRGIGSYLVRLSSMSLTQSDEREVGSMHHTISDIERIGDHAQNLSDYTKELSLAGLSFSGDAVAELKAMHTAIEEMFPLVMKTFESHSTSLLKAISDVENSIDNMKEENAAHHIARLNRGECTVDSGAIFFNTLVDLERIADHLNNIAYSILPHRLDVRTEKIKEVQNAER